MDLNAITSILCLSAWLFSNVSIGTVPGREKTMTKSEFVSKVI